MDPSRRRTSHPDLRRVAAAGRSSRWAIGRLLPGQRRLLDRWIELYISGFRE